MRRCIPRMAARWGIVIPGSFLSEIGTTHIQVYAPGDTQFLDLLHIRDRAGQIRAQGMVVTGRSDQCLLCHAFGHHARACPRQPQLCFAKSPSSSCCSDETTVNEDNSSLENLCQRVFSACSCKQQGVIALRKFATILGASRQLLMDIFSILTIVKVVEEQVDTLLSKAEGNAREGIRTSLWKISVILSALHLIVRKRGPLFKWSGRGVATHLNSLAHLRLVQRYQEASYCLNKKASYCLNKCRKIDLEKLIRDYNPDQHTTRNVNWQFDPLTSLSSLYTPQQVITLQQHNPGFLLNFVRYYRQLFHKYGRNSDALVHLPFPLRPCYSSFCLLKNLTAKATSFTTESHSGPTGMLQRNANFTSPRSFS
ncbi:hypothetical protein L7F22_064110 [Adiantum nelumboides]|nr:hypothetical protein [Adiantum nelumboides]